MDAAAILHADLDAFYASVEQLLDPSLRGRPVAVGGGVVLAASYEARAFGVRSGMPGRRARELCPALIFVGGHFGEYQRLGDAAIGVLADYTPDIERISIDEAFADVSGCEALFGAPAEIARLVRARVRAELGLPISIGVARTKHLAKIASQVAKPDGLAVVDPNAELEFLHALPVELMWGVGPATKARLAAIGVATVGQLAERAPQSVERLLGRATGQKLRALAWNRDPRPVQAQRRSRSAGAQSALGRKPAAEHVYRPVLLHLAERIASRLRAKARPGRTVTVRVRFADLRSVSRALTLPAPISATMALADVATDLVRAFCGTVRTKGRFRWWRSLCRTWRRMRLCNWNCRSACLTMAGAPARERAWRDCAPIVRWTLFENALVKAPSAMAQRPSARRARFPTRSGVLPRRGCSRRQAS